MEDDFFLKKMKGVKPIKKDSINEINIIKNKITEKKKHKIN